MLEHQPLHHRPEGRCFSVCTDKIIPAWKVKDYPILSNFLNVKLFTDDFDNIFSRIYQNFNDGKKLHFDILDANIEYKNNITKLSKI